MSWLDVCLWWRLRGRRSGAALMDFQWRRRHALDRPRRREPHAGEPRVLERRREWDRPARQARSFLRNEVGPGCNSGPFNRGHHANRLVLSQGRGGACLAADYCARVQNDSNGSHFYLPSRGQANDTIKYIKNISYLDYSTSALQQGIHFRNLFRRGPRGCSYSASPRSCWWASSQRPVGRASPS